MHPTELIAYLVKNSIRIREGQWKWDYYNDDARSYRYVQYKCRFPSNSSQSLHYEVIWRPNSTGVEIGLHCENQTQYPNVVRERLGLVRYPPETRWVDCSLYTQLQDLVTEVEKQMSEIADRYESRIQEIEREIASGQLR